MSKPVFHTVYEPPPQVEFRNDEPSLTQQHFAEECDINNIVEKYMITGILGDPLGEGSCLPQYVDCTTVEDFHAAQTIIAHASQAFDLLPASLRKRFNNDPAQLLAFLEDESNREEAVKLGLVDHKEPDLQSGHGVSTSTPDIPAPAASGGPGVTSGSGE